MGSKGNNSLKKRGTSSTNNLIGKYESTGVPAKKPKLQQSKSLFKFQLETERDLEQQVV
jgi:hypothetical protein